MNDDRFIWGPEGAFCRECKIGMPYYDEGVMKDTGEPVRVWVCPECGNAEDVTEEEQKLIEILKLSRTFSGYLHRGKGQLP